MPSAVMTGMAAAEHQLLVAGDPAAATAAFHLGPLAASPGCVTDRQLHISWALRCNPAAHTAHLRARLATACAVCIVLLHSRPETCSMQGQVHCLSATCAHGHEFCTHRLTSALEDQAAWIYQN